MRRVVALMLLGGCGATVEGSASDASSPPADAAAGPPIDALPCVEGDAHQTAPDGSCFAMFTRLQTWTAAKATCAGIGGHAAILTTAAMDSAAEALVGTLDTFIGLSDEAQEGQFVWLDGTPLAFSNWHTGEPSDGGGAYPEDCVVIAGARATKQWDDRPCAPVANVGGGNYAVLCQR
jgi:hypothetical protein